MVSIVFYIFETVMKNTSLFWDLWKPFVYLSRLFWWEWSCLWLDFCNFRLTKNFIATKFQNKSHTILFWAANISVKFGFASTECQSQTFHRSLLTLDGSVELHPFQLYITPTKSKTRVNHQSRKNYIISFIW